MRALRFFLLLIDQVDQRTFTECAKQAYLIINDITLYFRDYKKSKEKNYEGEKTFEKLY